MRKGAPHVLRHEGLVLDVPVELAEGALEAHGRKEKVCPHASLLSNQKGDTAGRGGLGPALMKA